MSFLCRLGRILRTILIGVWVVITLLLATIQIEQHVLRRRAERLLRDIRSLQIHQATFSDVRAMGRKWGKLTHWDRACAQASCRFEIQWDDFYMRHVLYATRYNMLHEFMLAGGRPQRVWARVTVENGALSGKDLLVVVGSPGTWSDGRWWDYPLMGNVRGDPSFPSAHRRPSEHPLYVVGIPGGCDGPCKEIHFEFDPSLDSATVDRLMQFDLSCLTSWIHPCRTEADIMPNAWAQFELEHPYIKY